MIFTRRILLAVFLEAGVMAASAVRADEVLADKPVQKGGVSIQLPRGWQTDDHAGSHTLLLARAPGRDKDDTGEYQTLLTVSSEAGTKIDGTAQQARVAKNFANYKATEEPEAVKINGFEGVKFGGTLTLGPLKLRSRQYMLLHDSHIYTLTYMSLESLWESYAGAIEASAGTFAAASK